MQRYTVINVCSKCADCICILLYVSSETVLTPVDVSEVPFNNETVTISGISIGSLVFFATLLTKRVHAFRN